MIKKTLYSLAVITLLSGCKSQQVVAPVAPINTIELAGTITENELKEKLYVYASDEFEGRETGEPGQKKAVEYLKNHYVKLGIPSPLGDDDYFQEVPLERMQAPDMTMTINGTPLEAITHYVSLSSSKDGELTADTVIDMGYGIESEQYSDYKNQDVNGKIVLIRSGEPKHHDGTYVITGTDKTSKWSNMRQQFAAKRNLAKEKGAKMVLFYYPEIYDMVAARFGRSSGRLSLKGNADDMYMLLVGTDVLKALTESDAINAGVPIPADLKFNYQAKSDALTSENVIAYIKGSEKPEEYVVLSAHLDHEGIKNGEIYNGADDDGSGSVALLEIAEAFQVAVERGQGPRRSVVFLHVTAEEKGLLGSRYYTDIDPVFPLEQTVANLNIDMIGRVDPKRESDNRNYVYLIGSDKLSSELHELSEAVNQKYTNIELDYKYNDENDPNRFYYRSDHYNFAKNNIPIIFYFNGTHDDYHRPSDTVDKIEYDLLTNRTKLVFHTAWEVANREGRVKVDKAEPAAGGGTN
ncbi:MAG: M28 family peptidase [Flavobacteriaceae bacterium]|nr:M28 family peptidase [Flavobacteriaceae bacterium]